MTPPRVPANDMPLGSVRGLFMFLRESLEKRAPPNGRGADEPGSHSLSFYEEAPRHTHFSTTFDGETAYLTVDGKTFKITITPEAE